MRSPSRVDTSTLGWVKSEIDQSLEQAGETLRRFTGAEEDVTPLRSFGNSIHQVAGTLQMVELDGAAQFAQEIESLANAVVSGRVDDPAGAVGLLDAGLDHLSSYMARLMEGQPDRLIDNVEVINDLRRARKAEMLDGYDLFRPELQVYPNREQPVEELDGEEYYQRMRDLRQRYQGALLRWLRDQGDETAWREMVDVVETLYGLSRFQVSMQIWWVARAYLDVLEGAELSRDDSRKHPLAKLDQLMRTLVEQSEAAIAREGSETLVRYMLYHIGTSDAGTHAVREVIHLFELDALLGAVPSELSPPDASALAALSEQVSGHLHSVRAALDGCARDGVAGNEFLAADGHLREIAAAARESGIEELANVSDGIRRLLFADDEPRHSEEILVAAARALLFIEHSLEASGEISEQWRQEAAAVLERLSAHDEHSDAPSLAIESHEIDTESLEKHELHRLVAAVAGQVEESLREAEQKLEHVARDASDTDSMSAVVASLQQVHGAVRMLGQHKLCDLLETAISRMRELISGDAFPSDPLLDALAVTIGTADTYVKGMGRDAPNLDVLLNRAVRELESATQDGRPLTTDPVSTLERIDEFFGAWIEDNSDYDAYHGLRRSLRDIGALAHEQEQSKIQGITQEMVKLLDIVMDEPGALTDEVDGTLRRSLSALTEMGTSLEAPAGAMPTPVPVQHTEPPQEDADDIVRETFLEEARECLRDIDSCLKALGDEPGDARSLADMRRGFHTIKGSGRMVRARSIPELAWIVEDTLNRYMAQNAPVPGSVLQFVSRAHDELSTLLDEGLDSSTDLAGWRERATRVLNQQDQEAMDDHVFAGTNERVLSLDNDLTVAGDEVSEEMATPGDEASAAQAAGFREEGPEATVVEETTPTGPAEPALNRIDDVGERDYKLAGEQEDVRQGAPLFDDEVIKIFSKEALSHISSIRQAVDESRRQGEAALSDELLRAVHTLQGNARSLHLVEMSEAYTALDDALNTKQSNGASINRSEAELLDALLVATAKVLDHLNRDKRFPDVVRQELGDIAGRIENEWNDSGRESPVQAGSGGDDPLERLEFVSDLASRPGDGGGAPEAEPAGGPEPAATDAASVSGSVFDELVDPDQTGRAAASEASKPATEDGDKRSNGRTDDDHAPPDAEDWSRDALADTELKDVFVEEAMDTLSRIESALQYARKSGPDGEAALTLKRELHTLKGSSRAAGAAAIGDLSHDAETMLENISSVGDLPPDLLETLEEVHDTLVNLVQGLDEDRPTPVDPRLVERLRGGSAVAEEAADNTPASLIPEEGVKEPPRGAPVAPKREHDVPVVDAPRPAPAASEADTPARSEAPHPTAGRSTVRIHSNVLDKLVNYAGEVSISRSQLEEQLSGLKGNLNELRSNVTRFADQVRELDIQADTQIRARVSDEKVSDVGDFDPLELDRYSRLQQLSRSLSESVDDLVTIQSGLNRFAVQTEGVLSQQAMLNTELQDGLMSARMVPFNTLVPRLRHQARQTARELGKESDFTVTGGELEVDRSILEQLSEALEHMIRNSLDHGIESASVREAAGKPARGSVRIECRQEGNEVVLKFSDDGSGLDIDRIRSRAVEAGLLSEDADLTDDEVIQLVVLSGFSTAPSVTQLSGRGVGLDVVNDAVRRLGGTLSMENRPGEGVSFGLRLPLSLSITQAMFVRCGDQRFAIPLGVIETVMKTEPENLSEMSKDGDPLFRRGERLYTLMDLTATLGLEPSPSSKRIPVLLVRMGARDVAVRVDDLISTDEIVVKQLGDHLGRMSGISGATVTGDGGVVLILDVAELWLAQERLPAFKHEVTRDRDAPPRVMVVDDSLTVRKVTGRNLGRHGMEVAMARDGMDALEQLARSKPDVMLVDIEMPRMDGYELTTRIREDVNYRDIPIIVITSRAGAKHREKAMELGANAYLTKPYQERELLEEVNALLSGAPPTTAH